MTSASTSLPTSGLTCICSFVRAVEIVFRLFCGPLPVWSRAASPGPEGDDPPAGFGAASLGPGSWCGDATTVVFNTTSSGIRSKRPRAPAFDAHSKAFPLRYRATLGGDWKTLETHHARALARRREKGSDLA